MKSRPYQLPGGYSVTFESTALGIDCEWVPRIPHGRKARRLLPYYRAARNEWLIGRASALGVNAVVIEL